MHDNTFDYIIIGAGTAGCLLANRLSADAGKRVLMIEAGGKDDYHWIHIPVGYLYCIGNPRTDWLFQTEAEPGLNGRSLRYPRGKTLGGSSSINGMIYMRGQSRDYERWAELTGDDAWRWDSVLPAFRMHEDHYRRDPAHGPVDEDFRRLHGHHTDRSDENSGSHRLSGKMGGEWRVEKQRLRWDILDAFAEAARQAGIPATDDFNGGSNEGVGYFEVNQKRGWRWSTARAFLRPTCLGRPNFELWTGAQVCRLLLETQADGSQRCTGVEAWTGTGTVQAHAAPVARDSRASPGGMQGEVLLCAGSVGSPHILQLSGLGPAALLQQHGIEVRHDLPGVGANLQDHLQIRSVYRIKAGGRRNVTLNTMANSAWGKVRMGLEYALRRTGPMSMAPSQLGAFTRSDASQPHPNLQYHVQPLSLDAFGEPLHDFDAFTASVCNLNPTSRGTVQLRSSRFDEPPAIAPNYLATSEDRQVAADSLRLTRRIVGQDALAPFAPEEFRPGPQYQDDEELARVAGDIATTIFHPVGTTRMGRADDPLAVVDSHLRVRGVRGLRVVDAGVMPVITSGNTNAPTLMIAEKAAAWIACGE